MSVNRYCILNRVGSTIDDGSSRLKFVEALIAGA